MAMPELDWVRIGLSSLGAGGVAILVTIAIERFGGRLGGILGTIPTTIVPASWGLWLGGGEGLEGQKAFEMALYAAPAGMGLNALFLGLWRVLPQRLLALSYLTPLTSSVIPFVSLMSVCTLTFWGLCAWGWVLCTQHSTVPHLWGIGATLCILMVGLASTWTPYPAPKGKQAVSMMILLSRGLFAGLAIGIALCIAATGAQTLAGIASVFPAIFWTTMVSVWVSQGQAVSSGAVGPMMLGSLSVALYALSAPLLFQNLGPILGALCAWIIAVLCGSLPAYQWLRLRAKSE